MLISGSVPFQRTKQREKQLQEHKEDPAPEGHVDQKTVEEAHEAVVKQTIIQKEMNSKKLDSIMDLANFVLYKAKTVFPFDLAPDEVVVDTYKVSIIYNYFPTSSRVHSVMISDITDVFVDSGLFFAKLMIVDRGFVEDVVSVEHLKKLEAEKLRKLIQGLVVSHQQGIDVAKLKEEIPEQEIIDKIESLGNATKVRSE
jgi:hypothetical protein